MERHDGYQFVTVKTQGRGTKEWRNVTLFRDGKSGDVELLGNLEHATTILIDQQLVDDLQAIVDLNKALEAEDGQRQEAK